jgi:hypothetical protein
MAVMRHFHGEPHFHSDPENGPQASDLDPCWCDHPRGNCMVCEAIGGLCIKHHPVTADKE